MIKLSVNETKWSSLLAWTGDLILYISIWIFDFGPEKLPGPSRNGPLDRIPITTIFSERKPAPRDERSRQTKIFRSKQNRLPEPNGTQTSQNKRDELKWNTCTNNSTKLRQRKNENYALGTRGTLNMLNKVVAKLARKLNNPNVGEKTRKRVVERVTKASNEQNAPEPGNYPVRGIEGGRVLVDKPIQAHLDKSSGRSELWQWNQSHFVYSNYNGSL